MKPSPRGTGARVETSTSHDAEAPETVRGAKTNVPSASVAHDGRQVLSKADWQRIQQVLALSRRELEVVQHVFEGKKMIVIAQEMDLSIGTVKTYVQRVYQKLRVSDQRELLLVIFGTYLTN